MYEEQGIRRYQETEVRSVGPEKLIVLAYEAMMRHMRQGRDAALDGETVRMLASLKSAQAIIVELRSALDHEIGGEIARNLESLYDYMFHENLEAMVDHEAAHFSHNLRVLEPLLQAWRRIPPGTAEQAARDLGRSESGRTPPSGPDPAREAPDTSTPGHAPGADPAGGRERSPTLCLSA